MGFPMSCFRLHLLLDDHWPVVCQCVFTISSRNLAYTEPIFSATESSYFWSIVSPFVPSHCPKKTPSLPQTSPMFFPIIFSWKFPRPSGKNSYCTLWFTSVEHHVYLWNMVMFHSYLKEPEGINPPCLWGNHEAVKLPHVSFRVHPQGPKPTTEKNPSRLHRLTGRSECLSQDLWRLMGVTAVVHGDQTSTSGLQLVMVYGKPWSKWMRMRMRRKMRIVVIMITMIMKLLSAKKNTLFAVSRHIPCQPSVPICPFGNLHKSLLSLSPYALFIQDCEQLSFSKSCHILRNQCARNILVTQKFHQPPKKISRTSLNHVLVDGCWLVSQPNQNIGINKPKPDHQRLLEPWARASWDFPAVPRRGSWRHGMVVKPRLA